MISFRVNHAPVSQPRPRARVMNLRGGRHTATVYTPANDPVHAFREAIATAYCSQETKEPLSVLTGPVSLHLTILLPRTKAKTWKTRPMPREWKPKGRKDFDNILKAVVDSLNGLAWLDDRQVVDCHIWKLMADGSEEPGVLIRIDECKLDAMNTYMEDESCRIGR